MRSRHCKYCLACVLARLRSSNTLSCGVMSLWSRLSEIIQRANVSETVGIAFDRLVEGVRAMMAGSQESRQVAFTISMIALAAKMAKADGVVTADEVEVVKRLFDVPERERPNVARLFNLAKQDVAGFDSYAAKIRRLNAEDPDILEDILDGLFVIAKADGLVHEREDAFLERVAEVFGIPSFDFGRIRARHVRPDAADPYVVLGISRGTPAAEIKRIYRRLVADTHPDRLMARGVPVECVRLANDRLAALNVAYEKIERELVD